MKPLDKKDLIILSELLLDGRKSYSELAGLIKLSLPATKSRVDSLIEKGIIDSFTVNIDFGLLTEGRPSLISIKIPSKKILETAEILHNNKLIRKIFFASGRYNLILITHHITDAQKGHLINDIRNLDDVEDIDTSSLFEEMPERKELLILEPKSIKLICDYCKREFSDTIFSKIVGSKKRYFCCNTCLDAFEKRFEMDDL